MIITTHVFIQKNKRTEAYYKSLGYSLISVDWSRYRQFYVKLEDLPNSSRVRVVAKCKCCGKDREISFHQYREICHACNNKRPVSQDTRKKQSLARKGKQVGSKNPAWNGGRPKCRDCGVTLTGWRQKMCKACFLDHGQFGEDNPSWKNYTEEERKEATRLRKGYLSRRWARHIKRIFNNKCDCCGDKATHAHHLNNWLDNPELRFDESNGVLLCQQCHMGFHSQYGKRHNTTQQYLEFKEANHG